MAGRGRAFQRPQGPGDSVMLLTDVQVSDFNRAYAGAYELELPPGEAQEMLGNLVELYTRLLTFARDQAAPVADWGGVPRA